MKRKRYTVRYERSARKTLKKMDKYQARLIMSWISKNLVETEFPRRYGKPLVGDQIGKWRYRIRDYRMIAHINDDTITILIVQIGHRKEIYK